MTSTYNRSIGSIAALRLLTIILIISASGYFGCKLWGEYDNPVDPEAENYQGYPTASDVSSIVLARPGDGEEIIFSSSFVSGSAENASAYGLQISSDSGFSTIAIEVAEQDDNNFEVNEGGLSIGTYYWRCRAKDLSGNWSDWTNAWSFTMVSGIEVFHVSPAEGTSVPSTNPELSWNDVDGADRYEVQIAESEIQVESATLINTATSSYTIETALDTGTTYYFRIRAINSEGQNGVWSAITSFHVGLIEQTYVDAGTFDMGSNSGESDEAPIHTVTLTRSYFIATYEVTQAIWMQIMETNPSYFVGNNRPVEGISWEDAVTFCNVLSSLEGLVPAYTVSGDGIICDFDATGYRLPTEAEWEFAARGGKLSAGYTYSGTNNIENVAWYKNNSESQTHDVGTKLPNELGIYDMSGNVGEWCWDEYSGTYYSYSPEIDPTGPTSGQGHRGRGSAWNADPFYCRVANRGNYAPYGSSSEIGFRPVRTDQ